MRGFNFEIIDGVVDGSGIGALRSFTGHKVSEDFVEEFFGGKGIGEEAAVCIGQPGYREISNFSHYPN